MDTETGNAAAASGVKTVDGRDYMIDAKGALIPVSSVDPVDMLMDETVRKVLAFAEDISAQISRFKGHSYDDIGAFQALVLGEFGAKIGGPKGNVRLTSFDGTRRIDLQQADQIIFGPELQAAKVLIDECLTAWGADAGDELKTIVASAFKVDQQGKLNHASLFMLMRHRFGDERWHRAMEALRRSIRVIGSKSYMRFYKRASPDAAWQAVTVDLAAA